MEVRGVLKVSEVPETIQQVPVVLDDGFSALGEVLESFSFRNLHSIYRIIEEVPQPVRKSSAVLLTKRREEGKSVFRGFLRKFKVSFFGNALDKV